MGVMKRKFPTLRRPFCIVFALAFLWLAGCNSSATPDVRMRLVMKKYSFDPPIIHVKKGQVVELDIESADVQHGFTVPDLGIKEPVQPHRPPAKVIFKADRAGVFPMTCSIICGPGHDDMQGKIIVE